MPARKIRVRAHAKINLYLEVLGRRPDGFHEIRTLFQTVGLHDTLEVEPVGGEEVLFECATPDPEVPTDRSNLVVRAVDALRERLPGLHGFRVKLHKRIPAGAGLGGGSADAAAVLVAMLAAAGESLPDPELAGIAAELGSDVPFFLEGGLCLGEGRGERLTRLPDLPEFWAVIVLPGVPVSTAEVYRSWLPSDGGTGPRAVEVLEALRAGRQSPLRNDLEPSAFRLRPETGALLQLLAGSESLGCRMTGSGSALFGLFGEEQAARRFSAGFPVPSLCTRLLGRAEYATRLRIA